MGLPPQVLSAVVYSTRSSAIGLRQYQTVEELLISAAPESTGCLIVVFQNDIARNARIMSLLSEKMPLLPVIACLAEESVAAAVRLMHQGVFTVVTLPPDVDELSDTFRAAVERSKTLRSEEASGNLALIRMERATRKEREVLDLILQGLKNKEIGAELGITVRAVEDRRFRLMKKVGVESVAELVALAMSAKYHKLMYPGDITEHK